MKLLLWRWTRPKYELSDCPRFFMCGFFSITSNNLLVRCVLKSAASRDTIIYEEVSQGWTYHICVFSYDQRHLTQSSSLFWAPPFKHSSFLNLPHGKNISASSSQKTEAFLCKLTISICIEICAQRLFTFTSSCTLLKTSSTPENTKVHLWQDGKSTGKNCRYLIRVSHVQVHVPSWTIRYSNTTSRTTVKAEPC